MDHVAIMKKSWGLIEKIESGEKTIESRWYKFRHTPWDKIFEGDTIYFKNSGEPIKLRARTGKILQFENLNGERIAQILDRYGEKIGIGGIPHFTESLTGKNYCILIYLANAEKVPPFSINKKGFGISSAWLVVDDIREIIKK